MSYDSVGTLCPACGAGSDAGAEAPCPWCGLDLRSAEADELRRLTGQLAELDRELWEIGERRRQLTAELGSRQQAAAGGALRPQPPAPGSAWGPPPHSWAPPRSDTGSTAVWAPRPLPSQSPEWSIDRVRSVLLWVGAALLTVSALTFTTVAWARLDDGGRALLLAGVTALCVGAALSLRRRLPATAEAFTGLSIALALIDWQALRRAGMTAGMSTSASWAIGSLIVSAFAFALGSAVGRRTSRAAIALLIPLALELAVATVAGAAWGFALGFALIAGAMALAWGRLRGSSEDRPARVALMTHAIATWSLAAILVLIATVQAHTLVQSLVPAAIVLTLALVPVALLRGDTLPGYFEFLATLVCALVSGALVVVASTTFGPEGMLAWATVVASAAIVIAPSLPRRWTMPACVAGIVFGVAGLAYGAIAALTAIFAPLAWLRDAWTGSLATPARDVFAGPRATDAWPFGWPSVVALVSSAGAIAAVAVPIRRRHALVSVDWALGTAATFATLALCVAPVVAGASAGVACAIATGVLSAVLIGAAMLDRSRPQLAISMLPIAILPAIATTGWASLTCTASMVVLGFSCVVAVFATGVASSHRMRRALGAYSGATAITLAGVATVASGRSPAVAGFVIALAAGGIILAGVHGRWRAPEGVALEVVGAAGFAVGASIAAQHTAWLAGTLTVIVPMLLIAAVRQDRRVMYSVAAGAAAVGATWASLAAAHVAIVEAYTAPAAAIALVFGLLEWRRGPARSWLALGPAIVLGLGPTLVLGIAHDDNARTIIAAVVAFAIVAFGAWKQLQAPLVLGSVALLTLAVDTFGPALARLPRWLPPAVIGLLLMWIGATFETRRDRAKRATQTLLDLG